MMRNDDTDEIDLSRHRPSRLPGLVVIGAAIGVAVIAAWVFTPILMSKDTAATASLLSAPKARAAAPPARAAAAAVPVEPAADTTAATSEPAPQPPPVALAAVPDPAPAASETTASTPWGSAPSWPQSRGVQVAAAPPAATPPAEDPPAAVADVPAEPIDNVPLPRKRPSRLIAASLVIPLPRPRPEIEVEAPTAPTTFDLQVERMR